MQTDELLRIAAASPGEGIADQNGAPPRVRDCPSTDGSPLKRCSHSDELMSTALPPPGRSSLAEKFLPIRGSSPSVGSKAADACRPMSCSGSPRPVQVKALPI